MTHEILIHRLESRQSRSDIDQHGSPYGPRVIEDQAMGYPGAPVVRHHVKTFESEPVPANCI
jgi:hypothetical protein